MKKTIRTIVLLILVIVLNNSCDLQKENPNEPTQTTSAAIGVLTGVVSDETNGGVLSEVVLTINGISKQSDTNGNYSFGTEIGTGSLLLAANKPGYIGIVRNIEIKKDVSTILSLKLFKKEPTVTINAATGGTVGLNSKRVLQIPANALLQNTDISVTQILGAGIPVQFKDRFIIEAVSLEPNGLSFRTPASLQVPNSLTGINPSLIKAVSISSTGNEELTNLVVANNTITVPLNHFSYIYFYVDLSELRYKSESYEELPKPSNAIADCNSIKAEYEITLSPKVTITNEQISVNTLAAQVGYDFSTNVNRTLKIDRIPGERKKQLYYQLSGVKYIFEIRNETNWIELATIELPDNVKVIAKDIEGPAGICHDQGGTRPN